VFCANQLCIFYWYWRPRIEEQAIQGLPLDSWGTFHFFVFNTLSFMAVITHQRAAFSNPGRMPEGMQAPFHSEHMKIVNCERCIGKETWKPVRAHHCAACGFCVFKVSKKKKFFKTP
jgi:ribosomal protein L37E